MRQTYLTVIACNSFIQSSIGNVSAEHLGILGAHILPLVWRCGGVKGLPAPPLLTLGLVLGLCVAVHVCEVSLIKYINS